MTPRQNRMLACMHDLTAAAQYARSAYDTDHLSDAVGGCHERDMLKHLQKAAAGLGYRLEKGEVEVNG